MNGYGSHEGGPTLILLSVVGVLNVLNMQKDASLACWALFFQNLFFLKTFLNLSPDVSFESGGPDTTTVVF